MKGQEQNRGRTQNPHAAGPSRGFVPPAAVHNVPQKESQWYNPARQQEPLSYYTQQISQAQQMQQPSQGRHAQPVQPPQGYPQQQSRQGYSAPGQQQQPPQGYYAPPQQQQPPQGYYAPRQQQLPPRQNQYAPRQQQAPQGYYPGQQGPAVPYARPQPPKPPKKPVKFLPIAILAVLIIVAAVLGANGIHTAREQAAEQAAIQQKADMIQAKVEPYRDRFCPGVYVNGIDLGGMTYEEAKSTVESGIQAQHADWKVTLTYGSNHADITASDLNFTVDVTGVLNEAMQQGHNGTDEQRYNDMLLLEQTPYRTSTARPSAGNTQRIDDLLAIIKNSIDRPAQDAYVIPDQENINAPFQFYDEVNGLTLDTAPIREWIFEKLSTMENGTYEIKPDPVQPSVRKADLMQKYSLRASATTKIHTSSTEDRNNNIRHALCDFVNGYKLAPGETFSFNTVVGYRTAERGFYPAQEIAYGNYVEGYGGGVCQASTTLYQAALCAGLQIVERKAHSEKVRYTELGLDATVYMEKGYKHNKDFRFKNNTDGDIYIFATVEKDPTEKKKNRLRTRVDIYGPYMGDVHYELQSTIIETLYAEPEYKKDKKHEYTTYPGELYLYSEGREGYKVNVYRTNTVNQQSEWLYTDTYEAKKAVYYEGV